MKFPTRNYLFVLLSIGVYVLLSVISMNNCYFWDTPQLISKEAHWFYLTDFSSFLLPAQNSGSEFVATGYHPPLMGMMTAALWKVFGYKLWVSHAFTLVWAVLLLFNVYKLLEHFFTEKKIGWVMLIVLLESTLLAQFSIASPDFILFTAFIIALRAVFERKPYMLSVAVFFLSCISMRGVFIGAILFAANFFYHFLEDGKKLSIRLFFSTLLPYLPTFIILVAYYAYYFIARGWFFTNSPYAEHYIMPDSLQKVVAHLAGFIIRLMENGRIVMWILGVYLAYLAIKSKHSFDNKSKVLLLFLLLLTGLFLLFVFITQMPFSARYFMPIFFLLTVVVLQGLTFFIENRKMTSVFFIILCFELTGHFWIYPEKTAKSWECTLAHLPYYGLREACFNYIETEKMDYNDISAGFCLYGNRRIIELNDQNIKNIGGKLNRKYFIYSNISNLEDESVDELKNPLKWKPIKEFKDGYVFITIYKNLAFASIPK